MKYVLLFMMLIFLPMGKAEGCFSIIPENQKSIKANPLKIFDFDELETYLATKDKTKTYVINFWATWCAPCVKELPYFEQLNKEYSNKKVEVILISLDFPKHLETKLKPFLDEYNLQSEVIFLNDVDSNTWIPKVDKDWSGAIPATIIYNQKKTLFYERSFEYQELETELKQFLN